MTERFYDEQEVQEILSLAGVVPSGNSYSLEDLTKAAAEISVPESAIKEAAADIHAMREESADRREFRRKKIRELILWSWYPVVMTLLFLPFMRHDSHLAALLPVYWLMPVPYVLKVFRPRASEFETEFQKWRLQRVLQVSPDSYNLITDLRISAFFRSTPEERVPYADIQTFVSRSFGYAMDEAKRMLIIYFERHPDMLKRVE